MWLLADVFDTFRNNSLYNYRLYPSYYLSAPDLSWNAMHEMTKIELELIPDHGIIYSLRKVQEVEFLIFLIDTVKPTMNI